MLPVCAAASERMANSQIFSLAARALPSVLLMSPPHKLPSTTLVFPFFSLGFNPTVLCLSLPERVPPRAAHPARLFRHNSGDGAQVVHYRAGPEGARGYWAAMTKLSALTSTVLLQLEMRPLGDGNRLLVSHLDGLLAGLQQLMV